MAKHPAENGLAIETGPLYVDVDECKGQYIGKVPEEFHEIRILIEPPTSHIIAHIDPHGAYTKAQRLALARKFAAVPELIKAGYAALELIRRMESGQATTEEIRANRHLIENAVDGAMGEKWARKVDGTFPD